MFSPPPIPYSTTAMHEIKYISPIEYTSPPPSSACLCPVLAVLSHLVFPCKSTKCLQYIRKPKTDTAILSHSAPQIAHESVLILPLYCFFVLASFPACLFRSCSAPSSRTSTQMRKMPPKRLKPKTDTAILSHSAPQIAHESVLILPLYCFFVLASFPACLFRSCSAPSSRTSTQMRKMPPKRLKTPSPIRDIPSSGFTATNST